ncbi:unnamed protein product [Heligmosomoides polygyrus]|uniref:Secreted protein n=1 Tax=Heligmosomoides polygyrus TaxID=6339 RepID=A0A183FF60_HELPZ|nr:unnamed protein product [Heligmosomoides polygyrus]
MNLPAALQQTLLQNLLQPLHPILQWPAQQATQPTPQPTVVAPVVLPVTMAPVVPKRQIEQPSRKMIRKRPWVSARLYLGRTSMRSKFQRRNFSRSTVMPTKRARNDHRGCPCQCAATKVPDKGSRTSDAAIPSHAVKDEEGLSPP